MAVTNTESFTTPRDSLPNVYTNVTAREIDFVSRFEKNWKALRDIFGIMRPIKKTPGTQLKSYEVTVALEDGDVDPGCVIPYSKTTTVQKAYADIDIEKYAKAVPVEDVSKYGAEIAVTKSDDAFGYYSTAGNNPRESLNSTLLSKETAMETAFQGYMTNINSDIDADNAARDAALQTEMEDNSTWDLDN